MSTINYVPFDINRTAVERNATVKRKGTVPVQHADAIKPTNRRGGYADRRHGSRRKLLSNTHKNSRLLTERRQMFSDTSVSEKDKQLAKAHNHGRIIDLKV